MKQKNGNSEIKKPIRCDLYRYSLWIIISIENSWASYTPFNFLYYFFSFDQWMCKENGKNATKKMEEK